MEGKSYSEFFIFKMNRESRSDKHVEKSYYRKIILQKRVMCHFFQCIKMERNTPECYKIFSPTVSGITKTKMTK